MKSKKFPAWLTIEATDKRLFFSLTALYGIYILPILLANRLYQDDLSRSLYGVTGWNNDARPLTEILMRWLCGGKPLGNVAPLPLLLSVLLLAYTLTLYGKRYLPAGHFLPALGIGFWVIANPFFLSNLSYKFDCVTMVLALCAAILPYVVPERNALFKIFFFSFFLCMVTLTTYQPCCGVYISLWFLELFFMLFSAHIDLPRLIVRAAACALSVIVYKYAILNRSIRPSNGGWQPSAYQFSWRSENGIFACITQNFQAFLTLSGEYLAGLPNALFLLAGILLLLGIAFTALELFHLGKPMYQRILTLFYLILLPFFVLLGTLAPLLILTPSAFSISAHSLICLCSVGLWIGIMLSALYRRLPRLSVLLFLPCLLFAFTFSYTYGNALTSQKQYETYLTYSIAHDVESLDADNACRALTVSGRAPRSPEVSRLVEKYPLFARLVPTYLTNSSYMGGVQLLHYTQKSFNYEDLTEEDQNLIKNATPALANSVYTCYENGDKIIIVFK
ncbi:MAG: glucosyltransferase domain-containing protein [Lachnospiraceae bacterium]|nr:glucosyltransferase domain-containing protein [Lachnospiraceae bacterium]